MQSFLGSLVRHGRILAATRIQKSFVTVEPCRSICSTPIYGKVHKGTNTQKVSRCLSQSLLVCSFNLLRFEINCNFIQFPSIVECDSDVLKPYFKEIKELEQTLCEQLDKRLSLRTDLRLYEDFNVTCPDGKVCQIIPLNSIQFLFQHKLANLGQISKKGQLVVINFSKNPSVIQHAKKDLQAAIPDINVQQEGASLYIKTPPISRERRTEMVAKVRISLLNDYKKALNNASSNNFLDIL